MAYHWEQMDYLEMSAVLPTDVELERECFRQILRAIHRPVTSALELFGGIGVFRRTLEELDLLAAGAVYEMWENSPNCLARLRQSFPSSIVLRHQDSFASPITPGWDLISADFNRWTVHKWRSMPRYREVTDRLFTANASYIQLTDAAAGRVHLHVPLYSGLLDTPVPSVTAYLDGLATAIRRQYGYTLAACAYHHRAAYLLFAAQPRAAVTPVRVRRSTVGARLF